MIHELLIFAKRIKSGPIWLHHTVYCLVAATPVLSKSIYSDTNESLYLVAAAPELSMSIYSDTNE